MDYKEDYKGDYQVGCHVYHRLRQMLPDGLRMAAGLAIAVSGALLLGNARMMAVHAEDMPKRAPYGWVRIFSEDFHRDAPLGSFLSVYGNQWSAYPSPWRDNAKRGMYDPYTTLSVKDGVLNIYLHTERDGTPRVAALLPKLSSGATDQVYGRYTVRFRADAVAGYKTLWRLLPRSEHWLSDGEVDFPEGNLTGTMSAVTHYASTKGGQDAFDTHTPYTGWHTCITEWSPGLLQFYLDDHLVGSSTTLVPDRHDPMHWVLQTETSPESQKPDPKAAGNVQIDWVTVDKFREQ